MTFEVCRTYDRATINTNFLPNGIAAVTKPMASLYQACSKLTEQCRLQACAATANAILLNANHDGTLHVDPASINTMLVGWLECLPGPLCLQSAIWPAPGRGAVWTAASWLWCSCGAHLQPPHLLATDCNSLPRTLQRHDTCLRAVRCMCCAHSGVIHYVIDCLNLMDM